MARNKEQTFKLLLWSMRKKRMRAPIWAYLKKGRRRIYIRFARIHWRRTNFGHRIRRMLEVRE